MPYVNKKRPYKKEYKQQKARGEHEDRMERQRARRAVDKKGADKNKNGKADKREGKDVSHNKPLSKGGTNNPKNLRVVSRKTNRRRGAKITNAKRRKRK